MRRRRVNRLLLLAPAIAGGILALGWAITALPLSRGASVPMIADTGTDTSVEAGWSFGEYFRTGVHLLQVGRPADAAGYFEKALELRPAQPEVRVNLGFARLMTGDYRAAEESFRTALEYRPEQVNAYYGWAESLEAMGDLEGALGAMRTFIHLAPGEDEYVRRARSAVWEWSATLDRRRAAGDLPERVRRDDAGGGTSPQAASERLDGMVELARLDGGTDLFGSYSGKTVVLNVWATWCPPCRAELPSLQALQDELGGDGFAVIGLSIDRDGDFVREFLRETGVAYPNYLDPDRALAGRILAMDSYPQTLIVRPDGSIADRIVGAREWVKPEMVDHIRTAADGAGVASGPARVVEGSNSTAAPARSRDP